jgi:hypothetical protein
MLRRTLLAALLLPAAFLLFSCSGGGAGYGVVLWGDAGGPPRTGDIVRIAREMPINSSYLVSVTGEKKPREYPMGRVRVFKRRAEAAAFAKSYAASLTQWAVVMKQDPPPLPIRETPDPDGRVVYKLKWQQLVKIVSRTAEKASIKPYADYWYEVATEDGFAGWCFGHYLRTFSVPGDPAAEAQRILAQDETLDAIMGTTWRPDWFRDMQGRGTIDLTMFREDVGLFPSPAEKLMKLVLPLSTFEFRYTDIQKLGPTTYAFSGTDLRITVLDDQRITVSYRYKDQPVTGVYTVMKDDVAEIIAAEQKRRADLYDAIAKRGATLASSAYGTIKLPGDMRFTWEGFGKLVPGLVSPAARGRGTIDFTLRAAKDLAADYEGVLTFLFESTTGQAADPVSGQGGLAVTFLYKSAGGGLRLTSLSRDSIQGMTVLRPGVSPIVIFFSQAQ